MSRAQIMCYNILDSHYTGRIVHCPSETFPYQITSYNKARHPSYFMHCWIFGSGSQLAPCMRMEGLGRKEMKKLSDGNPHAMHNLKLHLAASNLFVVLCLLAAGFQGYLYFADYKISVGFNEISPFICAFFLFFLPFDGVTICSHLSPWW